MSCRPDRTADPAAAKLRNLGEIASRESEVKSLWNLHVTAALGRGGLSVSTTFSETACSREIGKS
jgi:hypothetical protein